MGNMYPVAGSLVAGSLSCRRISVSFLNERLGLF